MPRVPSWPLTYASLPSPSTTREAPCPTDDAAPQGAFNALLATLDLEPLEDNLFRGARGNEGWQRVFGGQVLGQALMAAARTVDPSRPVHSLHGYFLLAGDPSRPIVYDVERIRDGGSFTTRRVKAIQHGRPIFSMSCSFHKAEPGFDHQSPMPDVPPPEDLPNPKDIIGQLIDALPAEHAQLLEPRAADRHARRRRVALSHPRQEDPAAAHLDQGQRAPARRSGRAPGRACLCIRLHACSTRR